MKYRQKLLLFSGILLGIAFLFFTWLGIQLADACLEKIKALEKELATPDSGDSSEINTLFAVSAVCAVTALTLGAPILKKRQRETASRLFTKRQ